MMSRCVIRLKDRCLFVFNIICLLKALVKLRKVLLLLLVLILCFRKRVRRVVLLLVMILIRNFRMKVSVRLTRSRLILM